VRVKEEESRYHHIGHGWKYDRSSYRYTACGKKERKGWWEVLMSSSNSKLSHHSLSPSIFLRLIWEGNEHFADMSNIPQALIHEILWVSRKAIMQNTDCSLTSLVLRLWFVGG